MRAIDGIETCATCGQKNRVPTIWGGDKVVVCGKCKTPLLPDANEIGDDWNDDDDDSDDDGDNQ